MFNLECLKPRIEIFFLSNEKCKVCGVDERIKRNPNRNGKTKDLKKYKVGTDAVVRKERAYKNGWVMLGIHLKKTLANSDKIKPINILSDQVSIGV